MVNRFVPFGTCLAAGLVALGVTVAQADEPMLRRAEKRLIPGRWLTEISRLTASDASSGDEFGLLYAAGNVDGDTAIIGAWKDDNGAGVNAGSAYVFIRTGDTWSEQQKLVPSDGTAGDQFGCFVAVAGDTAIISAHLADHSSRVDAGAVYVFEEAGGTWSEVQKITSASPTDSDWFGWGLALDGDTLVVGSGNWGATAEAGSAEVFVRIGDSWVFQQQLTASDGGAGDVFGHYVAISSDMIVVTAPWHQESGHYRSGAAYVFKRVGGTWVEQQQLTPSDPSQYDGFGSCVAISDDTIMIGSNFDDQNAGQGNCGSVYVYARSGETWIESQELTASDAAAGDFFGDSVALQGDVAIVSAIDDDHSGHIDAGSLYVFTRAGSSWTERQKVVASDAVSGDQFGWGIPISGDTVFAGAALDDHSAGVDAGSVYAFRLAAFADGFESGDTSAWSATVP